MGITLQSIKKYPTWLILIFVLLFVMATPRVRGWNEANRLALTQSLVDDGQFHIDDSPFFDTGDKVLIDGLYYSEKPPLPALLATLVYWPLHAIGLDLGYGWNLAYFFIILLIVKSTWFMGLYAFGESLRFTKLDQRGKLLALLALAFGSLTLTWSSTLNNHLMAASFLAVGNLFWLRSKREGSKAVDLIMAGLALQLAASMDLPTGAFYSCFLIVLFMQKRPFKDIILFLLPLSVTVVPYVIYNYSISGSILPFQWHLPFFDFPGSTWVRDHRLVNSPGEAFKYLMQLLLSNKGFIVYNPLLILALFGLYKEIAKRGQFKLEALIQGSASLIVIVFYAFFTDNFSGDSYSVRWFVPLLPGTFFFLFRYILDATPRQLLLFRVLLGTSVIIAMVGLINPWSDTSRHASPFIANLMTMASFFGR